MHEAPHLAFSGLDLFLNSLLKTVRLRVTLQLAAGQPARPGVEPRLGLMIIFFVS